MDVGRIGSEVRVTVSFQKNARRVLSYDSKKRITTYGSTTHNDDWASLPTTGGVDDESQIGRWLRLRTHWMAVYGDKVSSMVRGESPVSRLLPLLVVALADDIEAVGDDAR